MNVINLASLNIDVSELTKSTAQVKTDLEALKKKQKELAEASKASGGVITQEQIEVEISVKQLSKAYADNMKVITANAQATKDLEKAEKLIESAMQGEISTINEARGNIALLTRLRNDTNASTEEGVKRIKELNEAIDKNNEFIKENGDAMLKLKMNIGNYSEAMSEAFQNVNLMNGGIMGFIERSQEAGGAGNLLATSFKGMTAGLLGMVKAGLAFIATPIGAVLAGIALTIGVIVGAFKFMVNEMKKTEDGSDKLARVMSIFSGVLNTVTQALKPLAEFIFKTFVKALETAIDIGGKVINTFSKVARTLGFDGVADAIDNTTKKLKENVKIAQELAIAEENLTVAKRNARLIQLQYQKDAEKLRQTRDAETDIITGQTVAISKRIDANNKLGALLKRQSAEELAIARQALRVADLRIKAEGASAQNNDARAQALTEIADIQERITGQESEQLANLNSLRKEASDRAEEIRKTALANALATSAQLLDKMREELNEKKRSTDEQIALLEKIAEQEKKVANDTFKASEKTGADKLKLQNDLAKAEVALVKGRNDIVVAMADREVQIIKDSYAQQLADGKIYNQDLLNSKLDALNQIAEAEKEANKVRLEKGLLNQQEYNDAINKIDEENRVKKQALTDQNRQAERDKQIIDLENEKAVKWANFEAVSQIEKEQNDIKLQADLLQAEKTGADTTLIKDKYAEMDKAIDRAVAENKLEIASNTFASMAKIAGEQTALGKAFAVAQATIDTYKGAVSAYSAMSGIPVVGPALGAVAAGAVVVSGLANVKKIVSTKTPKAKKGAVIKLGGNSHDMGGTTLYDNSGNPVIEAEKNELLGVMNTNASSHFMDFNNAFNGSGTLYSSGGEVSTIRDGSSNSEFASIVVDAIKNLPPPVVTVEDINYKTTEVVNVTSNGDL